MLSLHVGMNVDDTYDVPITIATVSFNYEQVVISISDARQGTTYEELSLTPTQSAHHCTMYMPTKVTRISPLRLLYPLTRRQPLSGWHLNTNTVLINTSNNLPATAIIIKSVSLYGIFEEDQRGILPPEAMPLLQWFQNSGEW